MNARLQWPAPKQLFRDSALLLRAPNLDLERPRANVPHREREALTRLRWGHEAKIPEHDVGGVWQAVREIVAVTSFVRLFGLARLAVLALFPGGAIATGVDFARSTVRTGASRSRGASADARRTVAACRFSARRPVP